MQWGYREQQGYSLSLRSILCEQSNLRKVELKQCSARRSSKALQKNAGIRDFLCKVFWEKTNKGGKIYPQHQKMGMSEGQRLGKGYSSKAGDTDPLQWAQWWYHFHQNKLKLYLHFTEGWTAFLSWKITLWLSLPIRHLNPGRWLWTIHFTRRH